MTREELEIQLGPASNLIVTMDSLPILRKWAVSAGHTDAEVAVMTTASLVDLYHNPPPRDNPSGQLRMAGDMLAKLLEALNIPGFDTKLQRAIAREELFDELAGGNAIRLAIGRELERLAPRRLEIIAADQITQIDGPSHYMTETVIKIAALGHPVMLVGPAGCGKTTIGEHTAKALRLPFHITNVINETHELTGFIDGHGNYHTTPFRLAFEYGGVWIADEIDAWDASALLAANSALANGYAAFPDVRTPVTRHANFRMLATANTFGNGADRIYIGRNELDAASLDRFATINVDYDQTLEQIFARGNDRWLQHVWKVRKRVNEKKIRHVVSSRAIQMGALALSAGLEWSDVEDYYLFKGMSKTDREKCR